jgi:tuftelin-interacting protein 11
MRAASTITVQEPLGLVGHYGSDDDNDNSDSPGADPQPQEPRSGTARMIQEAAKERRAAAEQAKQRAAQRTKALRADPELAKFESHSRGVGSKLMKMMGWKPGEGIGAKRHGMSKPIEVELRPKLAGLGAANERSVTGTAAATAKAKGGMPGTSLEEAGGLGSSFKAAWKARNRSKMASKEVFKTVEEVLQDGEDTGAGLGVASHGITILDMTGPQTRVVTDTSELNIRSGNVAEAAASGPFPELQHNLKLLVDLAEADIRTFDAKMAHERDTAVLLAEEETRLKDNLLRIDKELKRTCEVLLPCCCCLLSAVFDDAL